ncbi:MAG: translocation/assembly module TamB domain-containing protein, partial [bacterium]
MRNGSSNPESIKSPPGINSGKRAIFILVALVLLFLLIVLSILIIAHRKLLQTYAPSILRQIADESRTLYELDFKWDDASVAGISDYSITGVVVTDIFTGKVLLTCDSIRIRSSLASAYILNKNPLDQITSVELNHPVVILGKEKEKWNTGLLLVHREGKPFHFPGRLGVKFKDGEVRWLGGEFSTGVPMQAFEVTGLEGTFGIEPDGTMSTDLSAILTGEDIVSSPIEIGGIIKPGDYPYRMTVAGDSIDLKLLAPWLGKYHISELAGNARTTMSILIGPDAGKNGYGILGYASISDGTIATDIINLKAENLSGDLNFSHTSLFTSGLSGNIEGANVTVRGRLGDFGDVRYDLVCDFENLPLKKSIEDMVDLKLPPINGDLNGRLELFGPPEDLDFLLTLRSSDLSVYSVPVTIENFMGLYANNSVTVDYCRARILSGTLTAKAEMNIDDPIDWRAEINLANLSTRNLKSFVPASLRNDWYPTGNISGQFSVRSDQKYGYKLSGIVNSNDMIFEGHPEISSVSLTVPIEISENKLKIASASVSGNGISAVGEGALDLGSSVSDFEGSITCAIENPVLPSEISGLPISGKFTLSGDVGYARDSGLAFDGEALCLDGRFGAISVPNLTSRIVLDKETLSIRNLSGIVNGGMIESELKIPLSRNATDGNVGRFKIKGLDVGKFLPGEYSSLVKTGIGLSGEISLDENGQNITANLIIADKGAIIGSNALATSGDGIKASIKYPIYGEGESEVHVDGSVRMLKPEETAGIKPYTTPFGKRVIGRVTDLLTGSVRNGSSGSAVNIPPISGQASLVADIYDLTGDPRFDIKISSDELAVDGIELNSLELSLTEGEGNLIACNSTVSTSDGGTLKLSGTIDRANPIAESVLELDTEFNENQIAHILEIAGYPDYKSAKGTISGSGKIKGSFASPAVESFEIILSESELNGVKLSDGKIALDYNPPNLTVEGFSLEGLDGFKAMGAGSMNLASGSFADATVVLRLDDFNIGLLSGFYKGPLPLGGVLSGTAQLARDALGNKVLYNASISDFTLRFGNDSLALGSIVLEAGWRPGGKKIELKTIELTRNGEKLDISGYIPASLADGLGADLLSLTVNSETGYTPDIPPGLLAAGVSWEGGFGPIDLALHGKLSIPLLTGSLALDVRNVRFGDLTIFDSMAGSIDIADSVVSVSPQTFVIQSKGWKLGLDGQADLIEFWPLKIVGRKNPPPRIATVQLGEGPVKLVGPGVDVSIRLGTGNDALALVMRNKKPVIGGTIFVEGGEINIAKLGLNRKVAKEPGPDLVDLDLHLKLGKTLKVSNGDRMEFFFDSGDLAITGPATYPVLTGKLYAEKGWIGHPLSNTQFTLTGPLELAFSNVTGFDPLVKGEAQTTLKEYQADKTETQTVITARFNGRLSSLFDEMVLTSEPPMSQDEILRALAMKEVIFTAVAGTIFGDEYGSPGFGNVVVPYISSYVSSYIRREANLSDFEFSY